MPILLVKSYEKSVKSLVNSKDFEIRTLFSGVGKYIPINLIPSFSLPPVKVPEIFHYSYGYFHLMDL